MNFWLLITELGDERAYFALVPFVYFVVDRRIGWRVFCALLLSGLTVVTLKNVLKLPRPPKYLWKAPASGYGFPSGHTAVSTTFWSFLAFKVRRTFAIAFVLIALIGMSRIMLGVHYLRDVVGGFVVGIAIGFLASRIEPNLGKNSKLLGVVLSSIATFCLYPLIGLYSFKIGGYLLGFGVAHILSVDFMGYGIPKDLKHRFSLFLICVSILFLGSVGRLTIAYPILSFLGCFVPNYIGNRMG